MILDLPLFLPVLKKCRNIAALNLKEIGAILEVSESRVSQILSQAMLRLKGKLKHWTQQQ
jgi:DNA-directed RNA polymerase specialized sigma subunit